LVDLLFIARTFGFILGQVITVAQYIEPLKLDPAAK